MGLVEIGSHGQATLLTFHGGDAGNRLSSALACDILFALRQVTGNTSTRAVVLQGGENFSVGADLKERAALSQEEWFGHHAVFEDLAQALQDLPQPTIAAVRGWALGGGAEIALACDIVVASRDARFGQPEALRGLVPGMGGPQLLQRRLPAGLAAYLLYTGKPLDAAKALRHGLVTFVDDAPLERALAIADDIAQASPAAVRALRRLLRRPSAPFREAYRDELEAWRSAVASGDAVEGARAFRDKRSPVFSDPVG